MDKDIIHPAYDSIKALQDVWHDPLKYFGCGTNSKWQAVEAKAAKGNDKSGQQYWVLIQRNLPENFVNTLLSPNMTRLSSTEPMGWVSHCTALFSGVRSTQICTCPLGFGRGRVPEHHSGNSNRRNNVLLRHRTSFILHLRQQWVRYFPWGVEANWLCIRVELHLILGFQFPQTTEKLRKFSNEIHWLSVHLSNSGN